jgi:BrnA antitoxin of type II toxin-antitoxin system
MREEYDFSGGHRGPIIKTCKEQITIRLDPEVIQWFREQVDGGGNYQALINDVLSAHVQSQRNVDRQSATAEDFNRQSILTAQADMADTDMQHFMDECLANVDGWT